MKIQDTSGVLHLGNFAQEKYFCRIIPHAALEPIAIGEAGLEENYK